MSATARDLLEELAALGVAAEARGGALVLRPAASVGADLRGRLRAAKADLLALLEARGEREAIRAEARGELPRGRGREPWDTPETWALLPEGADPANPPAGWIYCREGRLAGCWVGPGGELAAGPRREP